MGKNIEEIVGRDLVLAYNNGDRIRGCL